MPRICNDGPVVDEYCSSGDGASHWDVCSACVDHNSLDTPSHQWESSGEGGEYNRLELYNGDPQGTSVIITEDEICYGSDPYLDPDDYQCELCNKQLTDDD